MHLPLNVNIKKIILSFKLLFILVCDDEKKRLILPVALLYTRTVKKQTTEAVASRVPHAFPTESPLHQYVLLHSHLCALDII